MLKLCADSVTLMEKFYGANASRQMERASKVKFEEGKLTVFSDYEFINKYLKHERFEVVDSPQEAKVVWRTAAVDEEEWPEIRKSDFIINQFPF